MVNNFNRDTFKINLHLVKFTLNNNPMIAMKNHHILDRLKSKNN